MKFSPHSTPRDDNLMIFSEGCDIAFSNNKRRKGMTKLTKRFVEGIIPKWLLIHVKFVECLVAVLYPKIMKISFL